MKDNQKRKIVWLVIVNMIPAMLSVVMFFIGARYYITVFPVALILLTVINYRATTTVSRFYRFQSVFAVGLFVGECIATAFYYAFISNDTLTPLVGVLGATVLLWIVLVVTLCVAPFRSFKHKTSSDSDVASSADDE